MVGDCEVHVGAFHEEQEGEYRTRPTWDAYQRGRVDGEDISLGLVGQVLILPIAFGMDRLPHRFRDGGARRLELTSTPSVLLAFFSGARQHAKQERIRGLLQHGLHSNASDHVHGLLVCHR